MCVKGMKGGEEGRRGNKEGCVMYVCVCVCVTSTLTTTTTANRNDKAPVRRGAEVTVQYERGIGGIHGGYVCIVAAELTLPPRLSEDPACASCGVTATMDQAEDGARSVLRVVGGQDATEVCEDYRRGDLLAG